MAKEKFDVVKILAVIFTLYFTLLLTPINGQETLYDTFTFNMSIDTARVQLKNNKKKFRNIALGAKTQYAIRYTSLIGNPGDSLIIISLSSKKSLDLVAAEHYLNHTSAHFKSEGFKKVYAQENWSKPLLFEKKKPGIRFVDSKKKVLVEMEPRGQGGTGGVYNVFVTFYNYNWFMEKARATKG